MKKKLLLALVIISVILLVHFTGISNIITLASFKNSKHLLLYYVHFYYFLSVILYSLLYVVISTFAIPSPTVLTIIGGFLFGIFPAMIIVMIAATLGAIGSFLFARYSAGRDLQRKHATRLAGFNKSLKQDGHWYLLSIRLIPVVPFTLMNILSGLTKIDLFTFTWTTFVGIIPGTFIYIYAGSKLGTITKVSNIFSMEIIAALVFLSLLGLMPILLKRARK